MFLLHRVFFGKSSSYFYSNRDPRPIVSHFSTPYISFQALKCPDCSGPLGLPKPDMVCEECGRVACDSANMLEKVVQAHNMFVYGVTKLEKNDIEGETLGKYSTRGEFIITLAADPFCSTPPHVRGGSVKCVKAFMLGVLIR